MGHSMALLHTLHTLHTKFNMTAAARINTSTSFYQGSLFWILQGGSIVGVIVKLSGQYVLTLFGAGASVGHREFGSLMGAKLYLKRFLLA